MLLPPIRQPGSPAKRCRGGALTTDAAVDTVAPAIGVYLARALADGLAELVHSDSGVKIHYVDAATNPNGLRNRKSRCALTSGQS